MADNEEVSKTGVWIDSASGEVVNKAPVEGVQLVPEGGVITRQHRDAIAAAEKAASGEVEPVVDLSAQDEADESKPVKGTAKKAAAK